MGVDFYACEICGETFPDCGEHYYCGKCFSWLCCDCCSKIECIVDEDGELTGCPACTGDVVTDDTMLAYLLDKFCLIKSDVTLEILKERKEERN